MLLAKLKTLSEGADVAGTAKYFLANFANKGNSGEEVQELMDYVDEISTVLPNFGWNELIVETIVRISPNRSMMMDLNGWI